MKDIYNDDFEDKGYLEYKIISLCKKESLTQEEKDFLNYVFEKKMIDVNHEDGIFMNASAFFGCCDALIILKKHGAILEINKNDRAYRLAIQNNNIECIKLFD